MRLNNRYLHIVNYLVNFIIDTQAIEAEDHSDTYDVITDFVWNLTRGFCIFNNPPQPSTILNTNFNINFNRQILYTNTAIMRHKPRVSSAEDHVGLPGPGYLIVNDSPGPGYLTVHDSHVIRGPGSHAQSGILENNLQQ